jgi:hypothetical protein
MADLSLLKQVAEAMGLQIKNKTKMVGDYAGEIKCEFIVSDGDEGELAVVKGPDGDYAIQMDNYYNPICDTVGEDAALLTREYQTELHKQKAMEMGAVIASQEVNAEGYVFLELTV